MEDSYSFQLETADGIREFKVIETWNLSERDVERTVPSYFLFTNQDVLMNGYIDIKEYFFLFMCKKWFILLDFKFVYRPWGIREHTFSTWGQETKNMLHGGLMVLCY